MRVGFDTMIGAHQLDENLPISLLNVAGMELGRPRVGLVQAVYWGHEAHRGNEGTPTPSACRACGLGSPRLSMRGTSVPSEAFGGDQGKDTPASPSPHGEGSAGVRLCAAQPGRGQEDFAGVPSETNPRGVVIYRLGQRGYQGQTDRGEDLGGRVFRVRVGAGVAGPAIGDSGRSHRRQPEKQRAGKFTAALPQLPLADGYVGGQEKLGQARFGGNESEAGSRSDPEVGA